MSLLKPAYHKQQLESRVKKGDKVVQVTKRAIDGPKGSYFLYSEFNRLRCILFKNKIAFIGKLDPAESGVNYFLNYFLLPEPIHNL